MRLNPFHAVLGSHPPPGHSSTWMGWGVSGHLAERGLTGLLPLVCSGVRMTVTVSGQLTHSTCHVVHALQT